MPLSIGSIELHVGPHTLGAPDNLEDVIVEFIGGAQKQLDIAVQELESEPIAQAILDAKARRVRVRLFIEGDYLLVEEPAEDPWSPGGKNEANRRIFNALLRSKVDVHTDLNPKIFHQKFIVRDPEHSRAALLSGSTNFTPTGTHKNLNHVVIIKGKRIAGVYNDEFEEIATGTFGRIRQRQDAGPKEYGVSKVRVKVLFAPDHSPELEIMKQMLKAKERVDFAMFTFAQSSGIDDTMTAIQRSGIPIRGVLDSRQANQDWAATRVLHEAGIELFSARRGENLNKLHHKLMVLDRRVIIVGSFNYTGPANRLNDENIMVIGDLAETDDIAIERQSQLAEYALSEIDRIIESHGVRLT